MEGADLMALAGSVAEGSGTWKALAVGAGILAWRWWKDVSAHLCQAVPDALAIGRSISDGGIDIRLKVHLIDEEAEEAKTPE